MKRWAVAKLGFYEEPENQGGALVPKVLAYPNVILLRAWSKPGFTWCICRIATDNAAQFDADNEVFIIPDMTLGASWGSMPSNQRNIVKSRMEQAGFTWVVSTSWTVQAVLEYACAQIQPGVNVAAQDAHDPWG